MKDRLIEIDGNEEFEEAIIKVTRWLKEAKKGVMLHWGNTDKRYVLGEKGEKGKKPLICFGVNPSTAGLDTLTDPTISRIRRIVEETNKTYGDCDGWIMLNLYPQRATNPNDLHEKEAFDAKMMEENHKVIEMVFKKCNEAYRLMGWGNLIEKRKYLKESYQKIILLQPEGDWYIRGELTKKNNPRHQLYVANGTKIEPVKICEGGFICKIDTQEM